MENEIQYRRATIEDLKKVQLEILEYVHNFCEENKIKYWLEFGSLIGAIRHKGYIPWDDDLDIGMCREDYDKFISLFNKQNSKYVVKNVETDKSLAYPFSKVMDTETLLYEPDEKGQKLSIYIDLFVFDNVPDDQRKRDKIFKKRNFYNLCNRFRNEKTTSISRFKRLLRNFLVLCFKIFPRNFFVKKIVKNSKTYINEQTTMVGNLVGFSKASCPKECFAKTIDVEFEGKKYKAPIGYDKWLRTVYGDYMQLPPEEKRKNSHMIKAYVKNE